MTGKADNREEHEGHAPRSDLSESSLAKFLRLDLLFVVTFTVVVLLVGGPQIFQAAATSHINK
jgi:hypothetical protein